MAETLRQLVEAELAQPVDPRVSDMAKAIAARHGAASRAVLFYGSCLRESQLDGLMLDFYLIVSDYEAAYDKRWLAKANALIPPNVFPFQHGDLAAKYAVLSEKDFYRLNGPETRSVSVWARFAQPSRLVWSTDDAARNHAIDAVARAAPTLFWLTIPTMMGEARRDPLAIFRAGFALTYSSELRAERKSKGTDIVSAEEGRYRRFGESVLTSFPTPKPVKRPKSFYRMGWQEGGERIAFRRRATRDWKWRKFNGKLLSVVRLMKASATYAGGAEYIAWKINRHAGTDIKLSDWQKRHPLLAAISLLPRLLRSGAIR